MMRLLLDVRNWPAAMLVCSAWLAVRLPQRCLLIGGAVLGRLAGWLLPSRRLVAEVNIGLCFPDRDARAQAALVRANLRATGIGLLEAAMAYWATDVRLRRHMQVTGAHHLVTAAAAGRGTLVLVAHYTTVELACRLVNLATSSPVLLLGREHSQPLLHAAIDRARRRHCETTIEKKDLKAVLRALRNNRAIFYAPDQNFTYQAVFAPFFGVQAATVTATAELVTRTGCKVVPVWCRRDARGVYRLTIERPWENFPVGDKVADAQRINRWIETHVRTCPEQYLWVHRRFKTRPPGEPSVYPPAARRAKDRE